MTTGLFFDQKDPFLHTYQAISVLKILGHDVRYKNEICDKISEMNELKAELVLIDQILECKTKFKEYKPVLTKAKLFELYKEAILMHNLKVKSNWDELYKVTKLYLSNNKFGLLKTKERKDKSIIGTAFGIEILTMIAINKPDLKDEILEILKEVINALTNGYTNLNDEMIVFIEKNIPTYRVNYHVIKSLKMAKKLGVKIRGFNDTLYKMLNYFLTFKYELVTNIDNCYYLLQIYKLLEKTPLMKFTNKSFNYVTDKNVRIKFENVFGDKLDISDTTITVTLKENKEKSPKTKNSGSGKKKDSSYDLEDSEEEDGGEKNIIKEKELIEIGSNKENYVEFNLGAMLKGPGYYTVAIDMNNKLYNLKEHMERNIRSYSEPKLNSVEFEIIDKIDEGNNKHYSLIKYPQKYDDIFKATQDNTLIVRVRVNFEDKKKPTQMEQVFIRLKNIDLNKSYNAYASKFNPDNSEYFIGFELDDPVNMESYNGQYEMSIILSDPGISNVLNWEFGTIEISFTKPTDPLEEERNLKNPQQPKMEPTFRPEPPRDKNLVIASVFSLVILGITGMLIIVLFRTKSNVMNFPKNSYGGIMNILFVLILFGFAYILMLFWVNLNILETMFIFVVMFIPAGFITYKALKNHQIEIVKETEEEVN